MFRAAFRITSKYLCLLADGYRRKKQEKHFLMFVALLEPLRQALWPSL
jgi:hypothetical protein